MENFSLLDSYLENYVSSSRPPCLSHRVWVAQDLFQFLASLSHNLGQLQTEFKLIKRNLIFSLPCFFFPWVEHNHHSFSQRHTNQSTLEYSPNSPKAATPYSEIISDYNPTNNTCNHGYQTCKLTRKLIQYIPTHLGRVDSQTNSIDSL